MNFERFLVTGGCGSIGRSLVKTLLESGHIVCSLDISEDGLFRQNNTFSKFYGSNYKPFLGDIRDKNRLNQALSNVDYVYHCAALKHVALCEYNPFEALKTNVVGTDNLIQACISAGVKKLVFASSDKAVNPSSTMGATKLLAEKLVISSNNYSGSSSFKASSVRFGNVWGSNGSVGLIFKDQCDSHKALTVTSEEMTRFFITDKKAIELCQFAMSSMYGGEIFIADMGVLNIYELAIAFTNYFSNSAGVEIIGCKPGEKLYEELYTETEALDVGIFGGYHIIISKILQYQDVNEYWAQTDGFQWKSDKIPLTSSCSNRKVDPYELCKLIESQV